MPDFGDEMGEKLVQGAIKFVEGRMNEAWRDHKAKAAAAAKEEMKKSEQLAKQAAQSQAAADIVGGDGPDGPDGLIGELDKAMAEQAGKDAVSFKYDVGNNELDLPDEQSVADSVEQLHGLVQEKLAAAGCGGLLSWDFNEADQTLFCRVASTSVDKFREYLKGSQAELSDLAAEQRAQAEEYRRMEEAGEILSPDRAKFDVDMSELFAGGEQEYQETYQKVREAMNKVEIGPDVQIDRSGSKLSFTLHTDNVEAVDAAAASLAENGKLIFDEGSVGLGETLREVSDKMAFKVKKTLNASIEGGRSVSHVIDVPVTRLDDFQSAAEDLERICGATATVKGNELSLSFKNAADAQTSIGRIDRVVGRGGGFKKADSSLPDDPKNQYIASNLLQHARAASQDLVDGKTPTPPGMLACRGAYPSVISRS